MSVKKPLLLLFCLTLVGTAVLYGQTPLNREALPTGPMSFMEDDSCYNVFISTQTNHTLHNNNYFYVYDRDISEISKKHGHAHLVFKGLPFNILSLDAADFLMVNPQPPETGTPPPPIQELYFSVREDQSITQKDGTTFYAKQNDVVVLKPCGHLEVVFPGIFYNCPGVDGVSVVNEFPGDGSKLKILISPTEDWYCTETVPALHFKDADIACFDPNSGDISVFFRGSSIGIHTLDAFDYVVQDYESPPGDNKLFFSVRCPEYLDQIGNPVYLYDQDVAVVSMYPGAQVEHYILGNTHYLHDLDALSVGMENPGCLFLPMGNVRDEVDGNTGLNPTIK